MKNRILIIDDDKELVEMIRFRLEREGYSVITAFDGESGIEKAHREKPDLIILDVMMPGKDGFTVCDNLKSSADTCLIPIIFLSAKSQEEDQKLAYQLGSQFYIKKPYDPEVLLDTIRKAIK